MLTFSIRHKDLIEKMKQDDLKISNKSRFRIIRNLDEFNRFWMESDETGWNYNVDRFKFLVSDFLRISGEENLKAYVSGEYKTVTTIEDFIIGTKPEFVFDIIEIMFKQLDEDELSDFSERINEIFGIEKSPFRFLEGEFVRLFLLCNFIDT